MDYKPFESLIMLVAAIFKHCDFVLILFLIAKLDFMCFCRQAFDKTKFCLCRLLLDSLKHK